MITFQIILIVTIVIGIFTLFASEKLSVDLIALLSILFLLLTGLVTPAEAVSGFSNQATITILAMFILSEGIKRAGVIYTISEKLLKFAKTLNKQLFAIPIISLMGAFINNTASVTILAPMMMDIAAKTKSYATQLLIPVSYLSMAAGTLTLIGTSTNLLVNDIYVRHGFEPIGIFEISKMGIFVFLIVTIYFLTIGRYLLPKHGGNADVSDPYQRMKYNTDIILPVKSFLIGKSIKNCGLEELGIRIISLRRKDRIYKKNIKNKKLTPNDELAIFGTRMNIFKAIEKKLIKLKSTTTRPDATTEHTTDQFMIASGSSMIDQKIGSIVFTRRFDTTLVGIKRGTRALQKDIRSVKLKFGDIILIKSTPETIESMKLSDDFVYIGETSGPYRTEKMPIALGIMLLVVLLAAFNVFPIMTAAILGVILMVLTKVVNLQEGYRAINWQIIFLLAGVIPLGIALENTGTIQLVADFIVNISSHVHPILLLGIFYLITTLLTEIISNNAAAIILAPIAITISAELGLNPFAFIVVLMFAASTSYLTPIGYQTNTLIYSIGNYKFTDFTKVGAPLNLILMVTTTLLTVWIWGI